ncbi:MAG: hypothetical protein KGL40_05590 [Rhodocyclaceae bacterium]|nr:hypothetical protein [Rhodocyclaceae bacterium]
MSVENEGLGIRQKVEIAFDYLKRESPKRITVTEVCRIAEVGRSALYRNHVDLVERIRQSGLASKKRATTEKVSVEQLRIELKALEAKCEALTLVCLEQQLTIESQARSLDRLSNAKGKGHAR